MNNQRYVYNYVWTAIFQNFTYHIDFHKDIKNSKVRGVFVNVGFRCEFVTAKNSTVLAHKRCACLSLVKYVSIQCFYSPTRKLKVYVKGFFAF